MSEFSVIIPTLQRSNELHELVEQCAAHPLVLEVLVINNATKPLAWASSKVRVLQQAENIYVNPAWNLGAREARGKYLAIVNDDVRFDPILFNRLMPFLRLPGVGIVGPSRSAFDIVQAGRFYVRPAYHRPYGWGTMMFMRRDRYVPIPEDLRVYFGDDWLFHRQVRRNFTFHGVPVCTEMGTTSREVMHTPLHRADEAEAVRVGVFSGPYLRRFRLELVATQLAKRVQWRRPSGLA